MLSGRPLRLHCSGPGRAVPCRGRPALFAQRGPPVGGPRARAAPGPERVGRRAAPACRAQAPGPGACGPPQAACLAPVGPPRPARLSHRGPARGLWGSTRGGRELPALAAVLALAALPAPFPSGPPGCAPAAPLRCENRRASPARPPGRAGPRGRPAAPGAAPPPGLTKCQNVNPPRHPKMWEPRSTRRPHRTPSVKAKQAPFGRP